MTVGCLLLYRHWYRLQETNVRSNIIHNIDNKDQKRRGCKTETRRTPALMYIQSEIAPGRTIRCHLSGK